jgi:hypothetical protein
MSYKNGDVNPPKEVCINPELRYGEKPIGFIVGLVKLERRFPVSAYNVSKKDVKLVKRE